MRWLRRVLVMCLRIVDSRLKLKLGVIVWLYGAGLGSTVLPLVNHSGWPAGCKCSASQGTHLAEFFKEVWEIYHWVLEIVLLDGKRDILTVWSWMMSMLLGRLALAERDSPRAETGWWACLVVLYPVLVRVKCV